MIESFESTVSIADAKIPLGAVVIGGSSVCNASCIHCPTGKSETDHVARGVMSMDFFRSIIDQMAEHCTISEWIGFGLYGDSLLDPLIVERTRYVKSRFPDVMTTINTNGAAYSPVKHADMARIVDTVTLHIESLRPDVYDFLMRPLRLERVLQKADLIIRDFGEKVTIGTPLHRLNISERQSIVEYFIDRGCGGAEFVPLFNRCSNNPIYDQLAFAPLGPTCRSNILRNFIFDWDGAVFPCCNDFQKEFPIGNLHEASVREVLTSRQRSAFAQTLDAGNWACVPTCSKCSVDKCEAAGSGKRASPTKPPVRDAEAELHAVLNSTSWRITAPLRALKQIASRR